MTRWLSAGLVVSVLLTGCSGGQFDSPKALPSPLRTDFPTKETAHGLKFWPISAPVSRGVDYSFDTGHCGLDYLTDFDGSFWDPVDPNGGEPPSFFYNEDQGTMTLTSSNRAAYRSSTGHRVVLRRHPGPVLLKGLCA